MLTKIILKHEWIMLLVVWIVGVFVAEVSVASLAFPFFVFFGVLANNSELGATIYEVVRPGLVATTLSIGALAFVLTTFFVVGGYIKFRIEE